jgi:hypothetical protein
LLLFEPKPRRGVVVGCSRAPGGCSVPGCSVVGLSRGEVGVCPWAWLPMAKHEISVKATAVGLENLRNDAIMRWSDIIVRGPISFRSP